MSEFCKNKKSMMLALSAFFLAVTILAGSVAYLFADVDIKSGDEEDKPQSSQESLPPEDPDGGEKSDFVVVPEIIEEEEAPHYNVPGEMRGVFLTPGIDFLVSGDTGMETVKKEIDAAIASAEKLTMNSLIIDTTYGEHVIYNSSGAPQLPGGSDIMGYIVEKAREAGFYTYAIFDVSFYEQSRGGTSLLSLGAGTSSSLSSNLREFAEKYELDGILIDGYENTQTPQSYGIYAFLGSGIGYDNFMRQSPQALVTAASKTIRKNAKGTQVGLLASAVWENGSVNEEGSATSATFTSLGAGNADTRAFLTDGLVDFVAVKAYSATTDKAEPFETVVKWWADVAMQAGVPMYAVHASEKICTDNPGWQSQDQIMRQVIAIDEISGVSGSIFNNLKRLAADPQNVATTLVKYYNQEVEPRHILTQLEVTKPSSTSYTTSEPVVTFAGASDPNSPVTINGEAIKTDANGYFTVTMELKAGENVFTISHKDRTVTYKIVREIEILKDITPQGSIAAEGAMSINITALAYENAVVYAVVNGQKVPMSIDESAEDESARDSSYKLFSGQYKTPAAKPEVQNLGNIVVYAEWDGVQKSIQGALVKINKKAKIEDGVPVVVVSSQAMTYPPNTLDNIPDARFYPLPQGAMDYAVGDEIVYKKGSDTYTYYVLASGMRVESADIAVCEDYASGNAINGISVETSNGYTYVTVKTAQQVSYSLAYAADGVTINFKNTSSVPDSSAVDSNAMFGSVSWSNDSTLYLGFKKSGGFMGYLAYYDDNGNLVFRFNNPPNSVSGARIAIDPGHGGRDMGALGFLADYPEKTINLAIAQLLADDLVSRGANVLLLDVSGGMDLKERVRQAEEFGADLFVSVHTNTAQNKNATGTEVYYFYPFAKTLASSAAANVSSRLSTNNRGAKQSYYHVTLSSQMPSILVECGFLSNQAEYEKLIKSKNQKLIATGIGDSIAATIKAAATGYVESATSGNNSAEEDDDEKPVEVDSIDIGTTASAATGGNTSGNTSTAGQKKIAVEGVRLDFDQMLLSVGEIIDLRANVMPSNATTKGVKWKSSDKNVATVDSNGAVTAVGEGIANITVTTDDGGYKAVCEIEAIDDGEGYTGASAVASSSTGRDNKKVEDIDLNKYELDLYAGETFNLSLRTYPSSAKDVTVTWESTDTKVARVDSNGKVTAVAAGNCDIIATVKGTTLDAPCWVTVSGTSATAASAQTQGISLAGVSEIYFDNDDITLYINKTEALVLNSDKGIVNNRNLKWKSDDTSVATVSSDGVVQAKGKSGWATITAYTDKDGLYATCFVSVTNKRVATTSITINHSEIQVIKGSTFKNIETTVYPNDATNKKIKWTTTNDRIATVDSNGIIKAVGIGKCTVIATSDDNINIKAICRVDVVKETAIEWIELDMDYFELYVGEEQEMYYDMYPYISGVELVWESKNASIASVDQNGKVKALKTGTTVIKVRAKNDSSIWDECEVTVYK